MSQKTIKPKKLQAEIWLSISEQRPPENTIVDTKIDDGHGVRNVQQLRLKGRLWWYPDADMYIYTNPTHWKPTT